MATALLFTNGKSQAVRIPKELEFEDVSEVDIRRENGSIILTPKRKTWRSFSKVDKVDPDFMLDRANVIEDGSFEIGT